MSEDRRTIAQRSADAVTEFCGSWGFVIWSTLLILGWIGINTWWLLFRRAFDPYPFIALNLVLTVVSTLQGPLIMMSQNRQAERDREAVQRILEKLAQIETWSKP